MTSRAKTYILRRKRYIASLYSIELGDVSYNASTHSFDVKMLRTRHSTPAAARARQHEINNMPAGFTGWTLNVCR